MEHLEHDWEQQREQLSALLDNELDEQERAELETHLPTCAECRAELESLQRTRALVRALPQPALPRSFALPLEAASLPEQRLETAAARPTPRSAQPLPSGTSARRTTRRPSLRTLQWISSIAAVLGIVLLLSNAFSGVSFTADSAGTTSNVNQQPVGASTGGTASSPERTPSTTQPGVGTPAPTSAQPGATPTNDGAELGVHHSPSASSDSARALISTAGLGGLLLIFSACGFAIAWALRRRW